MGEVRHLLCDEMLAGLARWLRAAGHDAALFRRGSPDGALAAEARRSGRTLLTRDRGFRPAPGLDVVALGAGGLDGQAAELAGRLGLDWLAAPFTRCLVDGAPLEAAPPEALPAVPGPARARGGPFCRCSACGRVFWPGSHVTRMRARLEGWAAAGTGG